MTQAPPRPPDRARSAKLSPSSVRRTTDATRQELINGIFRETGNLRPTQQRRIRSLVRKLVCRLSSCRERRVKLIASHKEQQRS